MVRPCEAAPVTGTTMLAAKTNTYSGGKTIDSPSTPGGKYGSPK